MAGLSLILRSFSLEDLISNILYSILATFIIRLLDYLLNSFSKSLNGVKNYKIINSIEFFSILGVLIFIIVFCLGVINNKISNYIPVVVSANWISIFAITFFAIRLIEIFIKGIKKKTDFIANIKGLNLMVFLFSIFILILFFFKVFLEIDAGLSVDEIEKANRNLQAYLETTIHLILFSGGFLFIGETLNFFETKVFSRK